MSMKVFNVGDVLGAVDLNTYCVNTIYVTKAADTSRTSNTTLAADPDLVVTTLVANVTYWMECVVTYNSTGTANFKFNFTRPTGAQLYGQYIFLPQSGSIEAGCYNTSNDFTTTVHAAGQNPVGDTSLTVRGFLQTGSATGSMAFQWAQDTSGGTSTIVRAGSAIFLRRVA